MLTPLADTLTTAGTTTRLPSGKQFDSTDLDNPGDSQGPGLLVIDMQNCFLTSEGMFAKAGFPIEALRDAIPGVQRLVAAAHTAGIPIIFVRFAFRPDYSDLGILGKLNPGIRGLSAMKDGQWDAELIDELQPRPSDRIVVKTTYSSFHGTELEDVIAELGISRLVLAGILTDMCVEGTARDAVHRNIPVVVVRDATAALTTTNHEVALDTVATAFGTVVRVEDIEVQWTAPMEAPDYSLHGRKNARECGAPIQTTENIGAQGG